MVHYWRRTVKYCFHPHERLECLYFLRQKVRRTPKDFDQFLQDTRGSVPPRPACTTSLDNGCHVFHIWTVSHNIEVGICIYFCIAYRVYTNYSKSPKLEVCDGEIVAVSYNIKVGIVITFAVRIAYSRSIAEARHSKVCDGEFFVADDSCGRRGGGRRLGFDHRRQPQTGGLERFLVGEGERNFTRWPPPPPPKPRQFDRCRPSPLPRTSAVDLDQPPRIICRP